MIVGIDLGTTNSLIGAMDAGFPVLFADKDGGRLTPSLVFIPDEGEPVAGRQAAQHAEAIFSVKRQMGNAKVESNREGGLLKKAIAPEEVAAVILKKLKADAERASGQPVERAVITVPAYFNEAQRAATKRAGELAGFTVERLLSEPTAAALAYGLDRLGEKSKVAVYDFGGGTFDVSVLELGEGVFHVLSTHGDTHLGGDDLDAALAAKFGISRAEAADGKKDPSGAGFSESDFSATCLSIIERTRGHCLRSLHDAGLKAGDIEEVILVGGVTRMPLVREFVREVFGREPNLSQHPDEAVALGAVIQAGILDGSVQNVTLLDVTPLSLGIETFGGLMNVLIPRNTTIPCKAGEMFTNAAIHQEAMKISILQGEREMAADNWKLGEFSIPFTPAARGLVRIGVQFELDANGLLHVLGRDVATGDDITFAIRSAVEVSDEAVEKMLADSLEHAFEDMDDRQFVEAGLKADEMLPAVDTALQRLGSAVTGEEREAVAAWVEKVTEAREARSLRRLKAALGGLDAATEPLAARLVEAVMDGKL